MQYIFHKKKELGRTTKYTDIGEEQSSATESFLSITKGAFEVKLRKNIKRSVCTLEHGIGVWNMMIFNNKVEYSRRFHKMK